MFEGFELIIGIVASAFVTYVAYHAGKQSGGDLMENVLNAEHAEAIAQLETEREASEQKLQDSIQGHIEDKKKEQEAYEKMQKEWEKKDYTREETASKAISAWRSWRAGMSDIDDHHRIYSKAITNQFEAWQTKTAKVKSESSEDKKSK